MNKSPRLIAWMLVVTLLATIIPSAVLAAPATQSARPYSGRVSQTFQNCGITQVFGVVLDSAGNPQPGTRVRLWWPNGDTLHTTAGSYVRNETNSSGWDFTLNVTAVANTWYVAIVDGSGNLLSDAVEVRTTNECSGASAANAVKVEFRNAPASAPSNPAPAPSNPPPAAPVGTNVEPAPPITSGATCQTFTQTGYGVCDDANARFLSAYRQHGLQNVGYPVSQRFKRDGFVTQAFQKAIFQWRPDGSYVAFVNVFDELHSTGFDQRLLEVRQTPNQLPAGWEGNVPFARAVELRQALLNTRPSLRSTYFSVSDPLTFFGLPTSEVKDMGNHYAIRTQRAVLQEWKENVPWARAGQVTIANGGDIAKELGHLPSFALNPGSAPVAPQPTAPVNNPVPTPPPAPAPTQPPATGEAPRNLDPRLGALGVGIAPANVAPGQPYWRVVEIIWHDESQSGGRHSIFVDVLDGSGNKIVGQPLTIAWGDGSTRLITEGKPFPEYSANFPMYAPGHAYTLQIDGLPSERVVGMGLGDLTKRDWGIHVEYLIKYQRAIR